MTQQLSRATAFIGQTLLAHGPLTVVTAAALAAQKESSAELVLVFDDSTGKVIDLDPRGQSLHDPDENKARGRPRLGVVAREVTLLPRHWDWLAAQPGGASVTLRKLVETARRDSERDQPWLTARDAANRFLMAMLGDAPGAEEAGRALFAGDRTTFLALTKPWPDDFANYLRRLAEPVWPE